MCCSIRTQAAAPRRRRAALAPLSSPLGVRQERSPGVRQCNVPVAAQRALEAVRKKGAPVAAREVLGPARAQGEPAQRALEAVRKKDVPVAAQTALEAARKKGALAQRALGAGRLKPEQMGTVPVQSRSLKLMGERAQRCRRMTRSLLYLQGSCRLWHRLLPVYSWSTAIRPTISTGRSSRDRGTNPAADLSWRDPSYTSPFIER